VPSSSAPTVPVVRRRSVALTWFWALLAVALGLALAIWPYDRACGLRLAFYLGASAITLLVGFLAAVAAWAHRRGLAHILSLGVIAWAIISVTREVLPRAGYARQSLTWGCASQAPPAAHP
jgi:hypothetical protein